MVNFKNIFRPGFGAFLFAVYIERSFPTRDKSIQYYIGRKGGSGFGFYRISDCV